MTGERVLPLGLSPLMRQRWPEKLWIVRHGQSAGNVAHDAADEAGLAVIDIDLRDVDVPLSELGQRQAAALGRWFASLPEAERPEIVLSDDNETRIDWQFRQLRVGQRARQHLEGTRSSAVAAAAELAAELHHLRSGQKKPTRPD